MKAKLDVKKVKPKNKKQKEKAAKKRKHEDLDASSEDEGIHLKETRTSDEPVPKKTKWVNKQRVLVLCARGINHRDRHLMKDLKTLMPHHRSEPKMERWKTLSVVNEMCEMKHCNKVVLFEGRRKRDLYMWLANAGQGPSVKFLIENINTMGEMKLTGNCLRGSRPLLSFDQNFTKHPHLAVIKELLTQIFGVPNHHPKSQPFVDRVVSFTYLDNRIWYRHFQILSEDGGLAEVGPRFVMNPIKIFEGSFTGDPIWENPNYQSPAKHRQLLRKSAKDKYLNKQQQKVDQEVNAPKVTHDFDPHAEVFQGDEQSKAKELLEKEEQREAQEQERQAIEEEHKRMKKKEEMRKLKKMAQAKTKTGKKALTNGKKKAIKAKKAKAKVDEDSE
ncbi:brix domain-containing protein 2 [Culex quinquefasciatus]|uniref:Ribosome biogenesis protein BRX1 homolog n=1 Tax=Culex quinquefasciatus TaxID=7176 RepID=B0WRY6_CULQU|nr:ribosome biogenesis protein BRX1 homolog [Culex quinquefasciatus]EDS33596.1 brix domain-containing protein 2 [Culex quinquefasciatus]EDS37714.1 brix domain-containing protein 2 [Culex quinquefasciatus]|eukprot:XP_001851470.1 brix domain-containing protein 2 [Culex quinquefasciatus]